MNNETGAIQPVAEIGTLLSNYPKIRFHVDHVQGIGKVPLNLYASHIDLCSISGHKFHSVKGTGLLYVRDGVRLGIQFYQGGQQELKYRSGTENLRHCSDGESTSHDNGTSERKGSSFTQFTSRACPFL